VPAHDLFGPDLPDPLSRTLAGLHDLVWQTQGERTPPATVLELATQRMRPFVVAALRGLEERQMYNHLRELKARGRIRVENLRHGRIAIYPLRGAGEQRVKVYAFGRGARLGYNFPWR